MQASDQRKPAVMVAFWAVCVAGANDGAGAPSICALPTQVSDYLEDEFVALLPALFEGAFGCERFRLSLFKGYKMPKTRQQGRNLAKN